MLYKIKNSGKSLLGFLLTLTLVAGLSIAYLKLQPDTPVLAAGPGNTEPVFQEGKDTLYPVTGTNGGNYSDGILTVPASSSAEILSDLPAEESYCLSMTVKASDYRGFNWQARSGGVYFNIQSGGCGSSSLNNWYNYDSGVSGNFTDGLRVTIYSSTGRMAFWVGGKQVFDIAVTDSGASQPKVTWANCGVTITDIQIWTIATALPQYDPSSEVLYEVQGSLGGTYDAESKVLTVPSQGDAAIQTDMPADSAYYCTMTLKNEGNVEIQCRADGSYIQLTPFFYRIFNGDDTPKTEQIRNDALSNLTSKYGGGGAGVTLTFYSAMNTLKIWLGNVKIFDDAVLDVGAARPMILWSFEKSEVSNIQVWTEKVSLSDEPVYCETTDSLKYGTETLSVDSEARYGNMYTDAIPAEDTFYVSYTIKSDGDCWLYNRGNHGRLLLQKNYWCIYSASNVHLAEKSGATGLADGIRITFCVEPQKVSMWMNGEKVVEKCTTGNTDGVAGAPYIYANSGTTTVSNVKVWTKKASISGSSATLEGTIKFQFFLDFDGTVTEQEKSKANVRFEFLDGTIEHLRFEDAGTATENGYPFSCLVPAKEMADSVKIVVYYDGVKSQEYNYSIKQYAESVLTQTTDPNIQKLVKTMLNYGAYAQQYFNYNADNLTNAGLESADQGLLEDVVTDAFLEYKYQPLQSQNVIAMQNISLVLKSETTLRLYFTCASGVTADALEVTSSTCTPVIRQTEGGSYYIAIENIVAGSLGDMHTITVKNTVTGETDTCTVSALTYGYYALTGSTKATLQNLVKSLYLYNQAAESCLTK